MTTLLGHRPWSEEAHCTQRESTTASDCGIVGRTLMIHHSCAAVPDEWATVVSSHQRTQLHNKSSWTTSVATAVFWCLVFGCIEEYVWW